VCASEMVWVWWGLAPSRTGHASVVSWPPLRCWLPWAALPIGVLTIVVGLGWATRIEAAADGWPCG